MAGSRTDHSKFTAQTLFARNNPSSLSLPSYPRQLRRLPLPLPLPNFSRPLAPGDVPGDRHGVASSSSREPGSNATTVHNSSENYHISETLTSADVVIFPAEPDFSPAPEEEASLPTSTVEDKSYSYLTPVERKAAARKKRDQEGKQLGMAEPRARAARHKGQMNFPNELRLLLLAYGDPNPHPSFPSEPLPETVRVLDEIVTDFVLEMCHGAAQYASYSRRQKIKVDDFRFALRRDPNKLGRVQELLRMERELKEARKAFDQNDDQVGNLKEKKKELEELGDPEDGPAGKKSKGKGKRGAGAVRRNSDATEETVAKKRKL